MTDKELIELAAKAAGYKYSKSGRYIVVDGIPANWNPLEDDGDALRLAVKLELDIYNSCISVRAIHRDRDMGASVICRGSNPKMDPFAATRRAIVSAAAEIGGNME